MFHVKHSIVIVLCEILALIELMNGLNRFLFRRGRPPCLPLQNLCRALTYFKYIYIEVYCE